MADLDEKELYAHAVETYRFFLDWRAKLLAGYFAVLSVLAYTFFWMCEHRVDRLLCVVPLAGLILTNFFREIEKRNREQYRDCMNVGRRIEGERNLGNIGMFTEMHTRDLLGGTLATHSKALDRFFRIILIAFWPIFIVLFIFTLFGVTEILGPCTCSK